MLLARSITDAATHVILASVQDRDHNLAYAKEADLFNQAAIEALALANAPKQD
jgi:hypothetical protein